MKKFKTIVVALLISISAFSQVTISETKDDMTDKISYNVSEGLMCATPDRSKGFRIDANITVKKGQKVIEDLIITMVGLESCNDKNKLIILFSNGDKVNLVSWNKFNCKGTAYFSLNAGLISKLKANEIDKIRLTNGRSYKSYTSELEYKNYFIELFGLLD